MVPFHVKIFPLLLLGKACAFTQQTSVRIPAPLPSKTAVFFFNQQTKTSPNIPKPDPDNVDRFIPPDSISASQFYPPTISLLRSGPLPFFTRLTQGGKYEQAVYKYMYETRESDLEEAQANMDAFFSTPDVWLEQKMLESQGKRAVYKYAKPLESERVVLSLTWGAFVVFIIGRVIWKGILHF